MSKQPPKKTPKTNDPAGEPKEKKASSKSLKEASSKKKSKPKKSAQSDATKEGLTGFQIGVDAFGTVNSNLPVDAINRFLDKHVDDRKLNERDGPHADDDAGPGENA